MNLILAFACDEARIREDGKLDVTGVFNELGAPDFPAVQESMTVVFIIEWSALEAGSQPLRADLIDDSNQMILTIQGHTEVDRRTPGQPPAQTRVVLPLEQVPFPHAGRYRFRLTAGNNTTETLPLFVATRPQ